MGSLKSVSKKYLNKAKNPDELSFVREIVQTPSGRQFPYLHVECPYEVVFVVVENDKGEICLIKQHRHLVDKVVMEIPAGSPEPGQTLEQAAAAEAFEEAGLIVSETKNLGSFYSSVGMTNQKFHVFHAKCEREVTPEPEDSEFIVASWYTKLEIIELLNKNKIQNAGAAISLFIVSRKNSW